MTKQILTTLDFNNVSRITNLPNGVGAQEPATVSQLNAAVDGIAWKDNVRVATTANINLNNPGATIDGVTMVLNDRVLVKAQTQQRDNGIYVWNTTNSTMSRATDSDSTIELESAVTTVTEGSSIGTSFRQTSVGFVMGTGNIVWALFGSASPPANETTAGKVEIATQAETDAGVSDAVVISPLKLTVWSGAKKKYSTDIGDGSATLYTVTHNFNTRDLQVQVRRNSGNFDIIEAEVRVLTVNTVNVVFSAAPTANQYRVICLG